MLLDIREICTYADYLVIFSGQSERQIKALCEEIDKALSQTGVILLHQEGTVDSGWVLMDFGEVIIHIFAPEVRDYYQLDSLWSAAKPLIRIH